MYINLFNTSLKAYHMINLVKHKKTVKPHFLRARIAYNLLFPFFTILNTYRPTFNA